MKKGSIKDREYDRGHALLVNTDYPVQGKNISVFTVYFLNTPQLFSLLFSHWIGLLFFSYDKKTPVSLAMNSIQTNLGNWQVTNTAWLLKRV